MHINQLKCGNCGRQGRPGEEGFQTSEKSEIFEVLCKCENKFPVFDRQDQLILSSNPFCRLEGASNHLLFGEISLIPGHATRVTFEKPFDFPCQVFLTPNHPIYVKELDLNCDGMTVISSGAGHPSVGEVTICWMVFGLVNIDALPPWYVHFYSAITHGAHRLFKPALLDYAFAFESFLESFLVKQLTEKYDRKVANCLLETEWKTEKRCKRLLELATGHKLTDRTDLYSPWDKDVRDPRNHLVHGDSLSVTGEMVEKAHQATYQVIRWIQSLTGQATIF